MKLEPITRANRPPRKQVLMADEEAAALIRDGDVVIVGGFGTVNHPMSIIRALVRRKVRNLTVIGAADRRSGNRSVDRRRLRAQGCSARYSR